MKMLTVEKCKEWIDIFSDLDESESLSIAGESHLQAYRIALPILEQQERGEGGWIEWKGGECPVPEKSKVLVKWSDETVDKGAAGSWRWHHHELSLNIIAYRIIPERATNHNGEQ